MIEVKEENQKKNKTKTKARKSKNEILSNYEKKSHGRSRRLANFVSIHRLHSYLSIYIQAIRDTDAARDSH